jgi:hypothetical protein
VAIAAIACVLSGSSCSGIGDKIDEFRRSLDRDTQRLADAVPGSVFIRLLMEAHSSDKEVSEHAKQVIKSMYGVSVEEAESGYTLEVAIETPSVQQDGKPHPEIRYAIAQTSSNTEAAARELLVDGRVTSLEKTGASGWRQLPGGEVTARVKDNVRKALDALVGNPAALAPQRGFIPRPQAAFPNGLISHVHVYGAGGGLSHESETGGPISLQDYNTISTGPPLIDQINTQKQQIEDDLANAVMAAYSQVEVPAYPLTRNLKWYLPDGGNLMVFLDDESWKAYGGDIRVSFRLKADKVLPNDACGGLWHCQDWRRIEPGAFTRSTDNTTPLLAANFSTTPSGKLMLRWAAANVMNQQFDSKAFQELNAALKARKQ